MIEQEIIDSLEILPPGQYDPQYGYADQPPFGPTLHKDQTQDAEEAYDRAQIDRTRSPLRLRPPIYRTVGVLQRTLFRHAKGLRQLLGKLRFLADLLTITPTTRRPRRHQGKSFGDPIAPHKRIILV